MTFQEEQFKTALLDYLKKYHNSDSEKLRMVAGKFMMHREQAKAIEEQAKMLIKSLRKKTLGEYNYGDVLCVDKKHILCLKKVFNVILSFCDKNAFKKTLLY